MTAHPDDLIGWNFVNNTDNPMDDISEGHGTHTAGIIGAVGDNGIGVAGTNWTVQIMPVEFLDSTGSGTDVAAAEAIDYAVDHGAKVIGQVGVEAARPIQPSRRHFSTLIQGSDFVCAAGNNGQNIDNNPFPTCLRRSSQYDRGWGYWQQRRLGKLVELWRQVSPARSTRCQHYQYTAER